MMNDLTWTLWVTHQNIFKCERLTLYEIRDNTRPLWADRGRRCLTELPALSR